MYQLNIAGRIGKDAETRSTQSGDSVTSFNVATDVRMGRENVTKWTACTIWGERGEKLAPYLRKGTAVAVTGQLNVRTYESNGKSGVSVDCRVQDVTLLGGGKREEEEERPAQQPRGGGTTGGRHPAANLDDEIPFSAEMR